MKQSRILRIFSAMILLLSLNWSCSNKIDVIGEWKEIPIVYGIFSPIPENGVNYFRIEKAFLDPETDAFVIAQRPDSLYYGANELEVLLYERTNTGGYTLIDTLQRVDANTLGPTRDSGIFATTPNYIYVSDAFIPVNETFRYYKLVLKNLTNGKTFTQYCRGITPGNYDLIYNNFGEFSLTLPSSSRPIRWSHTDVASGDIVFDDVRFNWEQPHNAAIYDLTIILKYAEFEVDPNQTGEPEINGTRVYKEVAWKAVRNFIAPGQVEYDITPDNERFYLFKKTDQSSVAQELKGENFYNFLANNLSDVTGTNIRRCATRIDVRVDAAGPELAEYINARNANQNLIGGLFPADPFSNIEDGLGLFSYKLHVYRRDYLIDDATFEYLGSPTGITSKLGFRNYGCN